MVSDVERRVVLDATEVLMPVPGAPTDRLPARRAAGAVARYTVHDSPVWACADRHSLWGRIVTDPREVEAIRARVGRRRRRRGQRWFW